MEAGAPGPAAPLNPLPLQQVDCPSPLHLAPLALGTCLGRAPRAQPIEQLTSCGKPAPAACKRLEPLLGNRMDAAVFREPLAEMGRDDADPAHGWAPCGSPARVR